MDRNSVDAEVQISFIFPCLNERGTLETCIRQALAAISTLGIAGEIIVADNGSSDDSCQIASRAGARVVGVVERGYGMAILEGCRAAWGRMLVMADSDASYDVREAVPMIQLLEQGADLVVGSRFKGKIHRGAMPWMNRYIGNPCLTGLLNLAFPSGMSDAHCGMRAFTRQAFEKMALDSPGMEFASEMIIKATLLKLNMREVPINYYPDACNRRPHLRIWRDGWRHVNLICRSYLKFRASVPHISLKKMKKIYSSNEVRGDAISAAVFENDTEL